jgi:hypothetical protein
MLASVRVLAVVVVVAAGCGPILPASDRVPVSDGSSATEGDDGTRPGSDAPVHDDGETAGDDAPKFDMDPFGEGEGITVGGCPRMADVEPLPSAIEVIVDVSQTMATTYVDHDFLPSTEPITRWRMLATALQAWLPVLGDGTQLDMMIFPSIDALPPPSFEACESWIGPGLGTPAGDLLDELPPPESTFMMGANPADRAVSNAQSMLADVDDSTKRAIVLLTDGAPNCGEGGTSPGLQFDAVNDATRGWAEYAWALGIATHVVAIAVPEGEFGGAQGEPIANHLEVLAGIAAAGGTTLLQANGQTQLDDALAFVVDQTRSCRASLPAELVGTWIHVEIDGEVFYELGFGSCYGEPGFVYVDDGLYNTVEMCSAACDLFAASGSATLVEECAFPE